MTADERKAIGALAEYVPPLARGVYMCQFCLGRLGWREDPREFEHVEGCPVLLARKLLAEQEVACTGRASCGRPTCRHAKKHPYDDFCRRLNCNLVAGARCEGVEDEG